MWTLIFTYNYNHPLYYNMWQNNNCIPTLKQQQPL
jgi:hypothetical protein